MADRRSYRIRFQAPLLPSVEKIDEYFSSSRDTRWFSNGGPCHELLEQRMAAALGGGVSVIPVANATLGLMVALRALAGEPGQRRYVIVPSFTFIATVSAIRWAGFEPVFVDVDPDGWHADPESVNRAVDQLGDTIAVIMGCSTFGTLQPDPTLDQLRSIARRIGAALLVDSAAAFGSALPDGRHRGCDGDLDVYSLHATKPFAIGEGGLVVAPSSEAAAHTAPLVNFGFDVRHLVGHEIGINAKMDEWHCATALAVLDDFAGIVATRQEKSHATKVALAEHGFIAQSGSDLSSAQFVPILAPNEQVRDECLRLSRERGIEFRDYYRQPLHTLPALRGAAAADALAVTNDLAARALSLPLANDMSGADVDEVVGVCVAATASTRG